ncbi:MAG: 3'(2'),5'-bisphosphate nucleotidase CysQ [Verrucomicrobiae bacterium]|nr:3'(2'),5'-bisphosphate nucleotidase CysQ [Verrucomicrobiae bacterium]
MTEWRDAIIDIAHQAGDAIMAVYRRDDFDIETKGDNSPLTAADLAANRVIVDGLRALTPDIPILSEEGKEIAWDARRGWTRFWLVDPLDGTREFIKRNGEFTVNIALVRDGVPVLGVVYQPVGDHLYWASKGTGAWKSSEGGEPVHLEGGPHYLEKPEVTVVASRSHLTDDVRDFIADLEANGKTVEFLSAGSSLKLCLVAEGSADVYPRLGPTMEWDTGAAHAIALEAGRQVLEHGTGTALRYNKENLLNPYFIVE